MIPKLLVITAIFAILYASFAADSNETFTDNVKIFPHKILHNNENYTQQKESFSSQLFFEANVLENSQKIMITFELTKSENVKLILLNQLGDQINTIDLGTVEKGLNTYKIPINSLKKGTYFLLFKSNDVARYHKINI